MANFHPNNPELKNKWCINVWTWIHFQIHHHLSAWIFSINLPVRFWFLVFTIRKFCLIPLLEERSGGHRNVRNHHHISEKRSTQSFLQKWDRCYVITLFVDYWESWWCRGDEWWRRTLMTPDLCRGELLPWVFTPQRSGDLLQEESHSPGVLAELLHQVSSAPAHLVHC